MKNPSYRPEFDILEDRLLPSVTVLQSGVEPKTEHVHAAVMQTLDHTEEYPMMHGSVRIDLEESETVSEEAPQIELHYSAADRVLGLEPEAAPYPVFIDVLAKDLKLQDELHLQIQQSSETVTVRITDRETSAVFFEHVYSANEDAEATVTLPTEEEHREWVEKLEQQHHARHQAADNLIQMMEKEEEIEHEHHLHHHTHEHVHEHEHTHEHAHAHHHEHEEEEEKKGEEESVEEAMHHESVHTARIASILAIQGESPAAILGQLVANEIGTRAHLEHHHEEHGVHDKSEAHGKGHDEHSKDAHEKKEDHKKDEHHEKKSEPKKHDHESEGEAESAD